MKSPAMKVAIAADHAGLPLRPRVADAVTAAGHEPVLMGPDSGEPVDYPLVAKVLGDALAAGDVTRGILICGSGAGVTIAANKLPLVRAALAPDHYTAHQMVEHDDVNVLCLGSRVVGQALAEDLVRVFIEARFSRDDRHVRRVDKIRALER